MNFLKENFRCYKNLFCLFWILNIYDGKNSNFFFTICCSVSFAQLKLTTLPSIEVFPWIKINCIRIEKVLLYSYEFLISKAHLVAKIFHFLQVQGRTTVRPISQQMKNSYSFAEYICKPNSLSNCSISFLHV